MERNYSYKLRSKLDSLHSGSTLASTALQWPFSSPVLNSPYCPEGRLSEVDGSKRPDAL
jgi:hypothetical protein